MAADTWKASKKAIVCLVVLVSSLALVEIACAQPSIAAEEGAPVASRVEPADAQTGRLSFDLAQCKYLDRVSKRFELSDSARKMLMQNGFVVLPRKYDSTFGGVYHEIYGADLPVLITSDSILHVMHRSFDNLLEQLEREVYAPAIARALADCHRALDPRHQSAGERDLANFQDVDLYLTVARNLLAGEPAYGNQWAIRSVLGQDERVQEILSAVSSGKLQNPLFGEWTTLYGGRRPIDYSQFVPRGHYTRTPQLRNYFRALMWLGRPDSGWYVLGAHPNSGIIVDSRRELRDSVLMAQLLQATTAGSILTEMDSQLAQLLGPSDNLRFSDLVVALDDLKITGLDDMNNPMIDAKLREAILKTPSAQQRIAAQVFFGSKRAGEQIAPPVLVQTFGQRFAIDSQVLANVVYDKVSASAQGETRGMPHGLDVMAALGNADAERLLAPDLARWQYGPQLDEARRATTAHMAEPMGQLSLYDRWLRALATLHDAPSTEPGFPQVMRSEAWHLKQLQTELAAWAELRHDGILYVKQSYTRGKECEYPAGYVEPYPEFYAAIRACAERIISLVAELEGMEHFQGQRSVLASARKSFGLMASTMDKLETLARKELRKEPFTADEQGFLRKTVEVNERRSRDYRLPGIIRSYSGWYCDLLYPEASLLMDFKPTVADVHTAPNTLSVLQAGVGRADLALVAIDNGDDLMAFAGPVYTYYEFTQPAAKRLTDDGFAGLLEHGLETARPIWTQAFRVP